MATGYTVGPGTLIFGETGSQLEISTLTKSAKVTWSVDQEDDELFLAGNVEAGERKFTATLSVTARQELKKDGIVDWSWNTRGTDTPFQGVPARTAEGQVSGRVVITPIDLGGEVGKKPTSDFEWKCVGHPTYTPPNK